MSFVIIQKPLFGAPCNCCGECCKAGPCELAHDLLDAEWDTLCPALEVEADGRFSCGMYKRPMHYMNPALAAEAEQINHITDLPNYVAMFLGFGQGCGMEDPA